MGKSKAELRRKIEYDNVYGLVKQKLNGTWIVGVMELCSVDEDRFYEEYYYCELTPYQQIVVDRATKKLPKGLQD